jgi:hypothetical protein
MSASLPTGVLVLLVVVAGLVATLVVVRRRRHREPTAAPRVPAGERPPHTPHAPYQSGHGAHTASPYGSVPDGARDNPPGGGW